MREDSLRNFVQELAALVESVRTGQGFFSLKPDCHDDARQGAPSPIARLSRRIEACHPLDVLASLSHGTQVYWRSTDGSLEMAGLGQAERFGAACRDEQEEVFARMRALLSISPSTVKFYGGLRFDAQATSGSEWRSFGAAMFILPRVEIVEQAGSTYVAINLLSDRSIEEQLCEVDDILRHAASPRAHSERLIVSKTRDDNPNERGWDEKVRDVLGVLEGANRARKIVLSRCSRFAVEGSLSAPAIVRELMRASPRSFGYIFSPEPGVAFFGASPERLFQRRGTRIVSEALAGTTIRGTNQEHDQVLALDLLASRKNRLEHQLVIDSIVGQLQTLCIAQPATEETTTIKTGSVQHLLASIQGVLRAEVSDWDVVRALHPTPAVAGTPTDAAIRFIRENEDHDRGWYSGPVGYIGRDESELAVALRCALVDSGSVRLYVGAGLVSGSDEKSEWNELEAKVSPYLRLLQESSRHA